MKAINSAAGANSFSSRFLEERRERNVVNTGKLKRQSRRHQRHQLNAALQSGLFAEVAEGIAAYKQAHATPRRVPKLTVDLVREEVRAAATPAPMAYSATIIPFPTREVTVIRKRQFHRAVVETLRLAA